MTSGSTMQMKVLVADDEPAMLSLIARYMKSLGFSVIEASEGDSAWELARRHEPDLVILDVMMPGMSGWEICKRLKGQSSNGGRFSETGVIMLTGIGENLNEMTSPLFAADAWLNKPFDFTELDERIRDTLGRYAKQMPPRGSIEVANDPAPDSGWDLEFTSEVGPAPSAAQEPEPARPRRVAAKAASTKKAAKAAPAKKKRASAAARLAARPKRAAGKASKPKASARKAAKASAPRVSKKNASKAKANARATRGPARATKKSPSKRRAGQVASRKR